MRFLYQVSVFIDQDKHYTLMCKPLNVAINKPVKQLVFKGSEEGFKKWLKKVKAKDAMKGNPSSKQTTYQGIIDSIKNGKTGHLFMWSNNLPSGMIIKESFSFLDVSSKAKDFIEEILKNEA